MEREKMKRFIRWIVRAISLPIVYVLAAIVLIAAALICCAICCVICFVAMGKIALQPEAAAIRLERLAEALDAINRKAW
jgi:ABC-type multidrug transport system permease subunit